MNLGFSEMIFLFFLALIVFGPKKLPEIGRQIGKALAEFRRASNEFRSQLEAEMRQIEVEQELQKHKLQKEKNLETRLPAPYIPEAPRATYSPSPGGLPDSREPKEKTEISDASSPADSTALNLPSPTGVAEH